MDGERLAELRKLKDMTQTELGKVLHVNRNTISNYENNTATPDDEMKIKIANYFGVSLDYLLGVSREITPIRPTGTIFICCDNLPQSAKDELMAFLKDLKKKYHLDDKMFEEK